MTKQSLRRRVEIEAGAAGISIINLSGSLAEGSPGDGFMIGELGPLRVRFVRDRGQDWLEVSSGSVTPLRFYSFQDVQIALGWKSISEVLDMQDVEPLSDVLQRIASRWSEITHMLATGAGNLGWERVEKAANERREAFAARLC